MRLRCAAPLLLLPWALAPARPVHAAPDAISPVASATVTASLRTLHGCPLKRVITTPDGWRRVTDGLPGAPAPPDFAAGQVALLVVADLTGGADAAVTRLEAGPGGGVRVVLERREEPRPGSDAEPALRCFFFTLPAFQGGLHLDHRTSLGEGLGFVLHPLAPAPEDRDPARLPQLGPDLRLTVVTADGSALPADVALRLESFFPRHDLPGRIATYAWPPGGELGLRLPRIRDGVRHVLAPVAEGWEARQPLVLQAVPALGPDGSPAPVFHRFVLVQRGT